MSMNTNFKKSQDIHYKLMVKNRKKTYKKFDRESEIKFNYHGGVFSIQKRIKRLLTPKEKRDIYKRSEFAVNTLFSEQ